MSQRNFVVALFAVLGFAAVVIATVVFLLLIFPQEPPSPEYVTSETHRKTAAHLEERMDWLQAAMRAHVDADERRLQGQLESHEVTLRSLREEADALQAMQEGIAERIDKLQARTDADAHDLLETLTRAEQEVQALSNRLENLERQRKRVGEMFSDLGVSVEELEHDLDKVRQRREDDAEIINWDFDLLHMRSIGKEKK